MKEKVSGIWQCRYFWLSLVKMDLRVRYRGSMLGIGWSLLNPIAMSIVLCLVFNRLMNMEISRFGPFLLAGLCFWNYVTTVALNGCRCLFQGESYIRQFPAPLAIYPLRTVLGAGFHGLLGLGVVILASWYFLGFGNLPVLVSLIPAIVLLAVFGWALAILLGFANVYFPDVQHLTEVILQILFYATPIMYPPELLQRGGLELLADYNPLAACVGLIRTPILDGQWPATNDVALASFTVLLLSSAAVFTLARLERRLIFHL